MNKAGKIEKAPLDALARAGEARAESPGARPAAVPPGTLRHFLGRLWPYVRPYRSRLLTGLLCGVLYAGATATLMLVVQLMADMIFPGAKADVSLGKQFRWLPGFLRQWVESALPHFQDTQQPSKGTITAIIACIPAVLLVRAIAALRTGLFAHLQNLPLAFFSTARTGDLMSRINTDTQVLQGIIANSLSSMIRDPITIVFMVTLLLLQNPTLTLLSLVVLPACILPITIYGRKVRKSARAAQTHSADLASLMHESFTGNRIIKAYGLERNVVEQFRRITGSYVGQMMRVVRSNEIPSQTMEFLGGMGVCLILLYVVWERGDTSAGSFLGFIGKIFFMYAPMKSLTRLNNQLHQADAASQRIFEYFDTPNTVVDPPSPVPLVAAGADIRFENLEFAYRDTPVVCGINLTVKAGQFVALVGASGSGKTTLSNLLLRFYDPQGGAVRIGPTDLREASIADLRRQIALVAQETILFNDTIRANIALGRPGATSAEIEEAARHAYAHDFIVQQPLGYEQVVGEKGVNLSGGQRQRISIARAILRNTPILVLDEATSQLDAESERIVQAALDKLMQGRTTICISHRLSTIQKADVIVVLDQGRIVESGRHAQLIAAGGVYRKLYDLQSLI